MLSNTVKYCQNLSKTVKSCQKLSKIVKIWQKLSKYCQIFSKSVKTLSKSVKNCQNTVKYIKICQKLSKHCQNTVKTLSKSVKQCQKLSKHCQKLSKYSQKTAQIIKNQNNLPVWNHSSIFWPSHHGLSVAIGSFRPNKGRHIANKISINMSREYFIIVLLAYEVYDSLSRLVLLSFSVNISKV